jgi:crooked neck
MFEAKEGNEERARQLYQRGQELNPKDPVLFQSYGLFEYNCGHLAIARALFKRGIAVAPQHQPLWIVRYL